MASSLEALQQHVVAHAVGPGGGADHSGVNDVSRRNVISGGIWRDGLLGVEGHVVEAVSRLEGSHLDGAQIVRPAAPVYFLFRAQVEVVGGDVTRPAPFGSFEREQVSPREAGQSALGIRCCRPISVPDFPTWQDAAQQAGGVGAVLQPPLLCELRRRSPLGGGVKPLALPHQGVHVGEADGVGPSDRGQVLEGLARQAGFAATRARGRRPLLRGLPIPARPLPGLCQAHQGPPGAPTMLAQLSLATG